MSLIEIPGGKPRQFVEAPHGLERRVKRALAALGDLDLELPGLDSLAAALIALADELDGDSDLELDADSEVVTEDDLPLFASPRSRPPGRPRSAEG